MAFSGAWQGATAYESGAAKWGTGWNPVHAIEGAGYGGRVDKAIHTFAGPQGPQQNFPDPRIMDEGEYSDWGYIDEEFDNPIYGYGPETGTDTRPGVGTPTENVRGHYPRGEPWPSPGKHQAGLPGGLKLRAVN